MSRENTSSVDMANGKKMAYLANQEKATLKKGFYKGGKEQDEQVINARKAANLALAKAKAKKKAKMAKASRKKNKK
jgi:hypothetical protein